MKKRSILIIFGLIVFIGIVFWGISHITKITSRGGGVIKIGAMLPLTGNIGFIGENFRNGLLLSYDNYNVKDKNRVILVIEDHKNSTKDGIAIYSKFIFEKQMPLIIPTLTSITNAIIPLVKDAPRVLLGSILSGSDMPDKSEWLFRYFLSTPDEVTAMVDYFKSKNIKEIGVYYINDDYGLDAMQVFSKTYKGKITFVESYEKSMTDFKNLVPKALQTRSIYILGYGTAYGTFVKQLRTFGYKGEIYCFSSFSTPLAIKEAGPYGKGTIFTGTAFSDSEKNPNIDQFINQYKTKYGKDPDHYSVYGYDIGNIAFKAIFGLLEENKEVNPLNVRERILSWKTFEGLFGKTTIAENRDFKFKEVYLFTIDENGTIHKLK